MTALGRWQGCGDWPKGRYNSRLDVIELTSARRDTCFRPASSDKRAAGMQGWAFRGLSEGDQRRHFSSMGSVSTACGPRSVSAERISSSSLNEHFPAFARLLLSSSGQGQGERDHLPAWVVLLVFLCSFFPVRYPPSQHSSTVLFKVAQQGLRSAFGELRLAAINPDPPVLELI